ncbi:PAS domain-containing protein [Sphingomonas sp. CROZ-RG-20F-R02-07]|uniref:PAS domain-containing protein n=1 Tax=Sphingomonas sp. CROZ-RG-20F-R02-07 TaxID=2914832 RepID=UPI001F5900D4|nr:PAS domain-containing protein [Sphingomonas sp. CROZ-RG-20F-R02-07]
MADAVDPSSEAERTRVISAYDVEAVRHEGALDDVTAFVSRLCEAPVALVTVVGETEQLFLARTGLAMTGTPRDISFCTHAIGQDGLMEVRDATRDPRFVNNPLVTGETQVRFYAGMPLVTSDGVALGSVCVLDTTPRPEGLTPLQREGLTMLASLVMARLDDRRGAIARTVDQAAAARALEASELKFRTLADTMPQMVWSTLPDGYHDYYNARWYEFTGAPPGTTDGEGWNGMFHADDQDRAWTTWRHSLETGEPYSIEYRLRHFDGTYRWVLGRALPMRDEGGAIVRWFGTCTDIHEQKLAFEEREVISQELSHRIKNIFAVVAGLISFAARRTPAFAPIATDLRHRITALGRAHDFVRPHSARSRPSVRQDSLIGLLDELFAPYQPEDGRHLTVQGADIAIDDQSATPLALLFHELATNATKYGALAIEGGRVAVSIEQRGDTVRLVWRETGGPRILETPEQHGFGSQLIEMSAVRQLGGAVTRDWRPEGLAMTVLVPIEALRRN